MLTDTDVHCTLSVFSVSKLQGKIHLLLAMGEVITDVLGSTILAKLLSPPCAQRPHLSHGNNSNAKPT